MLMFVFSSSKHFFNRTLSKTRHKWDNYRRMLNEGWTLFWRYEARRMSWRMRVSVDERNVEVDPSIVSQTVSNAQFSYTCRSRACVLFYAVLTTLILWFENIFRNFAGMLGFLKKVTSGKSGAETPMTPVCHTPGGDSFSYTPIIKGSARKGEDGGFSLHKKWVTFDLIVDFISIINSRYHFHFA